MVPSAHVLRASVAGLLLLAGCEAGPRELDWTYRFEPATLRATARTIEARILRGGCTSTEVVYGVTFALDEGSGMTPPRLASGRFGFDVRALDSSCAVVAHGCEPLDLPLGTRQLSVPLLATGTMAPPCDAARCRDGFCEGLPPADGGPAPDAGTFPCTPGQNDCDGQPGCESDGPCHCGPETPPLECNFLCGGSCEVRCDADCEVFCDAGEDCAIDCGPGVSCALQCGPGDRRMIGSSVRITCRCSDTPVECAT
jgi:hypothetical protein